MLYVYIVIIGICKLQFHNINVKAIMYILSNKKINNINCRVEFSLEVLQIINVVCSGFFN